MRSEADVVAAFKDCLPKGLMYRRIEDASGNLGTWDSWIGGPGNWGLWLEFKFTETDRRRPRLRPGQWAFGLDLKAAGQVGFYVVGARKGNIRVLSQEYNGSDWKEAQLEQWLSVNEENVAGLLGMAGLGSLKSS